jgi:hypothetical protein
MINNNGEEKMPNFIRTTYYQPENFTVENYLTYQIQVKNIADAENNLRIKKQTVIETLIETFKILFNKIEEFDELIKDLTNLTDAHKLTLDKYTREFIPLKKSLNEIYEKLHIFLSPNATDDLLPIIIDSQKTLDESASHLAKMPLFLLHFVDATNQSFRKELWGSFLLKSSWVNAQLNTLPSDEENFKNLKLSFENSQPNSICLINLKLAFERAISLLQNEAQGLNKTEIKIFQHVLNTFMLGDGYCNKNEINKILEKISNENPQGKLNLLLNILQFICDAHQYNLNLVSEADFNQKTLVETEVTLIELSGDPEKKYIYYLQLYLDKYLIPEVNIKQQRDFSNLVSLYRQIPEISQEKYIDELSRLQEKTYLQFAKVYAKQETWGEKFKFFPLLTAIHSEAKSINSLLITKNDNEVIKNQEDFDKQQKIFIEYSNMAAIGVIQDSSFIRDIEATMNRLNQIEHQALPVSQQQTIAAEKMLSAKQALKSAATSDKILWDAITKSNVPLTRKLMWDLITLHRYCLKKTTIGPDEKLIDARINDVNRLTELYKRILSIRLSNQSITEQINNIKKIDPDVLQSMSIFDKVNNFFKNSNQNSFSFLFKDKKLPENNGNPDVSLYKKFKKM